MACFVPSLGLGIGTSVVPIIPSMSLETGVLPPPRVKQPQFIDGMAGKQGHVAHSLEDGNPGSLFQVMARMV